VADEHSPPLAYGRAEAEVGEDLVDLIERVNNATQRRSPLGYISPIAFAQAVA